MGGNQSTYQYGGMIDQPKKMPDVAYREMLNKLPLDDAQRLRGTFRRAREHDILPQNVYNEPSFDRLYDVRNNPYYPKHVRDTIGSELQRRFPEDFEEIQGRGQIGYWIDISRRKNANIIEKIHTLSDGELKNFLDQERNWSLTEPGIALALIQRFGKPSSLIHFLGMNDEDFGDDIAATLNVLIDSDLEDKYIPSEVLHYWKVWAATDPGYYDYSTDQPMEGSDADFSGSEDGWETDGSEDGYSE